MLSIKCTIKGIPLIQPIKMQIVLEIEKKPRSEVEHAFESVKLTEIV